MISEIGILLGVSEGRIPVARQNNVRTIFFESNLGKFTKFCSFLKKRKTLQEKLTRHTLEIMFLQNFSSCGKV